MTRHIARMSALAAALLVLPACHDYHDDDDPDIDLTIANAGSAAVHVEVEYWDADDHEWETAVFDVAPGTNFELEIWERWADVRIIRIPDGVVLFDDELDWHDFDDDDATITVVP